MKKTNSCPLDGNWMRDYCTIYMDHKLKDDFSSCRHRDNCASTRECIESDPNETVTKSKQVLIGMIPNIFEAKN